jgi:hypothetical protein
MNSVIKEWLLQSITTGMPAHITTDAGLTAIQLKLLKPTAHSPSTLSSCFMQSSVTAKRPDWSASCVVEKTKYSWPQERNLLPMLHSLSKRLI